MASTTRPQAAGLFIVACCALLTIPACSHRNSVAANPTAKPGSGADALIVSVEDVRRIANSEELTAHAHADVRQPPQGDINAPGPCRAAGTSDLTFGSGWSEFRSAGYHGITDDLKPGGPAMIQSVSQAVAVYPDSKTARSALRQLESALQDCIALGDANYNFTLDKPDDSTLRLTADAWSHVYREKSSVLMSVGVVGLEPAGRIATTILQTTTDRV
ncbi:hypothetical protein AWC27_16700 [Mycobacterium szulgai]|uniref:PknH-like extracellular domain-containing protein n=1 Tax=Mycobacterium szulgai TaxID=1787 RepID=A0A1X2FKX6_MYCSZ|nr:sensor domain-containing protein [Mycobacterium szulgai]ORX19084.1 hypothetical protein AWC27_16700 [Mycobacterium szulgai]